MSTDTKKGRASLAPPPPPSRQAQAQGGDENEGDETTAVDQIRSHLEDANQSLSQAYELLDSLDQQAG